MNCGNCGTPLAENAAFCSNCGTPVPVEELEVTVEYREPERFGMGMLGALVGSLLGGASIVIVSRLGYFASICGIVLAFCTLKGYTLLGKDLSKKGLIACVLLMILAVLVADWVDWALLLVRDLAEYEFSFGQCLILVPAFVADGSIPMMQYLGNLGMLYLFVLIGAWGTVRMAITRKG